MALVARQPGVEPIVLRDGRCGAGWSLFADEAGDLYAIGNGYFGFAHFFGEGSLYRVTEAGVEQAFSSSGEVQAIGRIR